jgi:predicted nucleic acid-binding protein
VILVRSDIPVEVFTGRDSAIPEKWTELGQSGALILFSPVTAAELWAGARVSEYPKLEALF